jgi:hypothetical protein
MMRMVMPSIDDEALNYLKKLMEEFILKQTDE